MFYLQSLQIAFNNNYGLANEQDSYRHFNDVTTTATSSLFAYILHPIAQLMTSPIAFAYYAGSDELNDTYHRHVVCDNIETVQPE